MNSGRTVKARTVEYDHQLQSQLAIIIELHQNVNMCSLDVSISAGNSAGLSLPAEVEVGRLHHLITTESNSRLMLFFFYAECPSKYDTSDSTPTTSSGTNIITSDSVVTDRAQQGEDIIIGDSQIQQLIVLQANLTALHSLLVGSIIAVIAVISIMLIVVATFGIICCTKVHIKGTQYK